MVSRTNYWKLGVFVLCATLVGLGAVVWIGASRLARETIVAYTYFDEAVSGLEVGSDVKFRGVTIGKVDDISTAPDRRHVEVTCKLYTDSLLRLGLRDLANSPQPFVDPFMPPEMRMQLVSSPLTGLTSINVDFFDLEHHPLPKYEFTVPWNTVPSERSMYKSVESGIMAVMESLPPLAASATKLATTMDRAIGDFSLGEVSMRARSLLDALEGAVREVAESRLVERSSEMVARGEEAFAGIRDAAADLRRGDGPVHRVADRLDALGARLEQVIDSSDVDRALAAVRQAGDGVSQAAAEGARLAIDARADLALLRETLHAVRNLASLLERDPGALLHGKTTPPPPARRDG